MTEAQKAALAVSPKHQAWKWIGSLFMERKADAAGEMHLAASLTRVLTLALFISVSVYWWVKPTDVPASMVHTLWGLLGLKGVYSIADAVRR